MAGAKCAMIEEREMLPLPSFSPPLRFMSPTIAARSLGRLSVDILCPSTETETSDIVMQSVAVCGRHIKRANVASGKCWEVGQVHYDIIFNAARS